MSTAPESQDNKGLKMECNDFKLDRVRKGGVRKIKMEI